MYGFNEETLNYEVLNLIDKINQCDNKAEIELHISYLKSKFNSIDALNPAFNITMKLRDELDLIINLIDKIHNISKPGEIGDSVVSLKNIYKNANFRLTGSLVLYAEKAIVQKIMVHYNLSNIEACTFYNTIVTAIKS
jgi:hypothetical protein